MSFPGDGACVPVISLSLGLVLVTCPGQSLSNSAFLWAPPSTCCFWGLLKPRSESVTLEQEQQVEGGAQRKAEFESD